MDENISEKLKSLLDNPDGLSTILSVAQTMMKATQNKPRPAEPRAQDTEEKPESLQVKEEQIIPASAQGIMDYKRNKRHNSFRDDERINLLMSIRPFLDDHKKGRVDSLVKALGTAKIINQYRDEDIWPDTKK